MWRALSQAESAGRQVQAMPDIACYSLVQAASSSSTTPLLPDFVSQRLVWDHTVGRSVTRQHPGFPLQALVQRIALTGLCRVGVVRQQAAGMVESIQLCSSVFTESASYARSHGRLACGTWPCHRPVRACSGARGRRPANPRARCSDGYSFPTHTVPSHAP